MRIVSRAEWGAAPARSTTPLSPAMVNLFVLHHTTGSFRGARTVRSIQQFHQGPERKWADIGYNFLVAPDGVIYEGRGWGFRGAHARGHNHESVGVAFMGDGSRPMPIPAQQSVLWLLSEAEGRFGDLRTVGHRDVGRTSCPGDAIYAWWASDALRAPRPSPKVGTPAMVEIVSGEASERLRGIPNVRSGWLREMGRRGWLRRR